MAKKSKKEPEEIIRVHVHLFRRDWEEIDRIYGNTIGKAKATRYLLRNVLNQIRAKAEQRQQPVAADAGAIVAAAEAEEN
jgi:hypothetical protein